MHTMRYLPGRGDLQRLGGAAVAVAAVTAVLRFWLHLTNPTTAALTFLLIVLITATTSPLAVAVAVSILADLCLNYFFMPPFGTLTIADPQNWVALFVFLAVSVVASNLSLAARTRAQEALSRRDEMIRLFDLSRDVLLTTDSAEAIVALARFIARRLDLTFAAICLPRNAEWDIYQGGSQSVPLDRGQLAQVFADAERTIEFDAAARAYTGHRVLAVRGEQVRIAPLRMGTRAVGLLAAAGRPLEAGTLDAIGGVVAIAIERAQFLEERKAAELSRRSEELKSALLASLAHDLRTPLTAIRVAASNLQATWLTDDDRREQSDLVLAEVERLARLFQNILEMARIDAGGVATEVRWAHPREIVEAAQDQVEQTMRHHELDVAIPDEQLVRLDPRLTAAALAHLLENAAQYSDKGTRIELTATVTNGDLIVAVRDHGRGVAPADLPHVFDRFYRGRSAGGRPSGTGMGLSIARGLIAAERGRIWAENCSDGGARFTISVPVDTKESPPDRSEPAEGAVP
jgi:two-component system sensor histidine kinase KdpD